KSGFSSYQNESDITSVELHGEHV
ncbi:GNAT family N-acetyltransferase, partial [Bacillus sp. HC-Mk]